MNDPTFFTRLNDLMQAENLTYEMLEAEAPTVMVYVRLILCAVHSGLHEETLDNAIKLILPSGVLYWLAQRLNVHMEWLAFGTGERVRDNSMCVVVETLCDENKNEKENDHDID